MFLKTNYEIIIVKFLFILTNWLTSVILILVDNIIRIKHHPHYLKKNYKGLIMPKMEVLKK